MIIRGCFRSLALTGCSARRRLSQNGFEPYQNCSLLIFLLDLPFALVFIEIQLHNEAGKGFDHLEECCGKRV